MQLSACIQAKEVRDIRTSFANANTDYRKLPWKLPCNWKKKAQGHSGFPSDVKNVVVGQTQLKFNSEKNKAQADKTLK